MKSSKIEGSERLKPILRNDRKPLWEMVPLKQPLRVNIDPCDLCNFKCDFCFQSKGTGFKGNVMTIEVFERIITQLKEFDDPINVIQLFCLGEPLINKDVPFYIKRIRDERVAKEVKITTNGSLLTHNLIDQLFEAGLDELVISLNGLNDDDFFRVTNTKVSFPELLDNIKYIHSHKNKGLCHFHVKIIGDYFSDEAKKIFIDTVGSYADTINIDGATNHWSGLTPEFDNQQYDIGGDRIKMCALCFYELVVHSDGTVSPCAVDWKKDYQNLGSVYESSLKDIWNSEFRRSIILSFLRNEENPYEVCRDCEYPNSGVSVNLEPYQKRKIIEMVYSNNIAAHISPTFAVMEIINVLFRDIMNLEDGIESENSDKLVLSNGHTALALYAVYETMGVISKEEFYTYKKKDSRFGVHPDRNHTPGTIISTGSLGHGLPNAVGVAYAWKVQSKLNNIYVMIGDGELNEGSIWESLIFAARMRLNNICLIVDDNKSTEYMPDIIRKMQSFGWEAVEVNGHDEEALRSALLRTRGETPYVVIADTIKGHGVDFIENNHELWHEKKIDKEEYEAIMEALK